MQRFSILHGSFVLFAATIAIVLGMVTSPLMLIAHAMIYGIDIPMPDTIVVTENILYVMTYIVWSVALGLAPSFAVYRCFKSRKLGLFLLLSWPAVNTIAYLLGLNYIAPALVID